MSERYRPFSNGSERWGWEEYNCCHCAKYSDDASLCDIQMAISEGAFLDGTISAQMGIRMGMGSGTCTEKMDRDFPGEEG